MAAFQAQAERDFEVAVLSWLQAHQESLLEDLPVDILTDRVPVAIARARAHGFTWQSSIASFVALMVELGPNFDLHPAFARALRDSAPVQCEDTRMLSVLDGVTDEDWEETLEFSDPSLWHRARTGGGTSC